MELAAPGGKPFRSWVVFERAEIGEEAFWDFKEPSRAALNCRRSLGVEAFFNLSCRQILVNQFLLF